MATAQDLLLALARAHALIDTGSSRDPELAEALDDVRDAQESLGWLVVRVESEGFSVQGRRVDDGSGELDALGGALRGSGIEEIRFQDPMEPELLREFLRRLDPSYGEEAPTAAARFRGLEEDLGLSFRTAHGSLPGMSGSILELFGDEPRPVRENEEDREDLPMEEYPDEVAEAEADLFSVGSSEERGGGSGGQRPPLPEKLEDLLEAFLRAEGADREARRKELEVAAGDLRERREMGTLGNLVEALAEEAGNAPGDVLALAQKLTTPALASQIVVRLGETRDEEDRARYIRLVPRLGREMALALADALGEARDRYQRRSYMDAMVAMGPTAMEVAEAMVQDPRWFVVRNGVSLLGEIGGEEIISHLTATLANSDARVRRETVQALAKVGGEDAVMLLLGMLGDPEGEVRSMACRALGILGAEKGFKPLLRLLEEDHQEDVQVECLQALGRIGDPGAVPLIEKRAQGGLFSKPNREIRIAAYRALAGIGTPHAVNLLKKGAKDSDSGVRTVVQSLLAERG